MTERHWRFVILLVSQKNITPDGDLETMNLLWGNYVFIVKFTIKERHFSPIRV